MRVMVVCPITSGVFDQETKAEFEQYAAPGTAISVAHLDEGPESIESEYEEALAVPDFLKKAKEAEAEEFDAVISDCFGDPGVRPAREVVDIPVVGAAESSLVLAASLGQRFSVITVLKSVVPMIENLASTVGLRGRLASVRCVNIPVLELGDREKLKNALFEEMLKAIELDEAHVLVLGCTGMTGVANSLQSRLRENGFDVPVIDPAAAALKHAETLVTLGLKQSRLTYMRPKESKRTATVSRA